MTPLDGKRREDAGSDTPKPDPAGEPAPARDVDASDGSDAIATGPGHSADAGQTPPPRASDADADADTGAACWYEYLGDWINCEDAGWPNFSDIQATSLQDCADACLLDHQCTAILDYSWLGLDDLTCFLHLATCDDPGPNVSAEEDGAKHYRKVCGDTPPKDAIVKFADVKGTVVDPESGCVFKVVAWPLTCEPDGEPEPELVGAATLDECLALCQERPDCSAVKNWIDGEHDGFECQLHLRPCDEPIEADTQTVFYKKFCESDAGATQ